MEKEGQSLPQDIPALGLFHQQEGPGGVLGHVPGLRWGFRTKMCGAGLNSAPAGGSVANDHRSA
jgi:hypothetical protein